MSPFLAEGDARGAILAFRDDHFDNAAGLVNFISRQSGSAKLRPDHTLVYLRQWDEPEDRLDGARYLVSNLTKVAGLTG